ncbi:MAG: hypothetical protein JW889_00030 [Verrucomicrobia bacterium]|nr:hypothetical protein [Verrucomicrobiota bacterium]
MTELTQAGRGLILHHDGTERARLVLPRLGRLTPTVEIGDEINDWRRVWLTWRLDEAVAQDELSIAFRLTCEPDFWWAPHLAPDDGDCIAQHVFRSPALLAATGGDIVAVIPDLELCGPNENAPWFMDLDAPKRTMWLGLSRAEIKGHVLYRKARGMVLEPGQVRLGFWITAYRDNAQPPDPWRRVSRFLWERYARPLVAAGEPGTTPLDRFVEHTYTWAFSTWRDAVWHEFDLGGTRVGAPAFIVNVTESPNYPGEPAQREFLSIWNQAWFSSLRSASGLMRYAIRTQNDELKDKARLTKELALSAPMRDGLFPSVYRTAVHEVEIDGKASRRSKGWATGYWTNSNRCPRERGIDDRWYHLLDASWTCLLMLRWHDELEPDARLVEHARTYAGKLLTLQDEGGRFPAWLHPETLEPAGLLHGSPEDAMHVSFLLKLAEVTGSTAYRQAALKTMDALLDEPVPAGRWEDFETYWSCSRFGADTHLGRRIERNAMYKQNTLSMFWTAEALLACHRATGDARYLAWGVRTLDELSMMQQVWQPPFVHIRALGGFGVMNADAEWNDARQSLFAELLMDYYAETGDPHFFERGIAALKASFVMMYCPENPRTKALYEQTHAFFGLQDYGFMMENYAHGGTTARLDEEIGDFTIYDWGNGAAAEARSRIRDHYGDVYVDRPRGLAFGIDSIAVEKEEAGWTLTDLACSPREVRIVFDDGSSQTLYLDGTAVVS